MSRRFPALALLSLGLMGFAGCRGGSASAHRDDEGRPCRLEVVGRPGGYQVHVEAASSVPGDATVEGGLRWRKNGSRLWHPVGDVDRSRTPGGVLIDVPLPDLVAAGDLVRLEVTWLDAAGIVTWRRALEVRAP
jgi:hypothetical protein